MRAKTEEENSRKTAVGSEHNFHLSPDEVRRIWMAAREEGRST